MYSFTKGVKTMNQYCKDILMRAVLGKPITNDGARCWRDLDNEDRSLIKANILQDNIGFDQAEILLDGISIETLISHIYADKASIKKTIQKIDERLEQWCDEYFTPLIESWYEQSGESESERRQKTRELTLELSRKASRINTILNEMHL